MTDADAFDPKAQLILQAAAQVFSDKGYHNASMRDIAKVTGTSLAGMYYYFPSKEDMLYSIQSFCFEAVIDGLTERLTEQTDPLERLRSFIHNHLVFFTHNVREMRVLSHESESLTGEYRARIQELKRQYFAQLEEIVSSIAKEDWDEATRRKHVLAIFGMVNWIYTWYDPQRDGTAESLGDQMFTLLVDGLSRRD